MLIKPTKTYKVEVNDLERQQIMKLLHFAETKLMEEFGANYSNDSVMQQLYTDQVEFLQGIRIKFKYAEGEEIKQC